MKHVVFAVVAALLVGILAACTPMQTFHPTPQTMRFPTMEEVVKPLPSGNWIVSYVLPNNDWHYKNKYFIYYGALYAKTINCPRFFEKQNADDRYSKTFGCFEFMGLSYNTDDAIATGFP